MENFSWPEAVRRLGPVSGTVILNHCLEPCSEAVLSNRHPSMLDAQHPMLDGTVSRRPQLLGAECSAGGRAPSIRGAGGTREEENVPGGKERVYDGADRRGR